MPDTSLFQTCQQPGKLHLRPSDVDGTDEMNDLAVVGWLSHPGALHADSSTVRSGNFRFSKKWRQGPIADRCLPGDVTMLCERPF